MLQINMRKLDGQEYREVLKDQEQAALYKALVQPPKQLEFDQNPLHVFVGQF